MKPPSSWDVYLVTDRALSRGRSTLEIVRAAVEGGLSAVQLREKSLSIRDFYEEALAIRDFLRAHDVPLIINDRVDLALALGADGVHLGRTDMPIEVARRILGPDRVIGLSVELPEHINEEAVQFADYLGISPVFSTPTKPDAAAPWGMDGLRRAGTMTPLPLAAIGSIKIGNAKEAVMAGAGCVAVVSAIVSADDPREATELLLREVRAGKAARGRESL